MEQIDYLSNILWRFYGSSDPTNHQKGIEDLCRVMTADNQIDLSPYYGSDGTKKFHERQFPPTPQAQSTYHAGDSTIQESISIYVREPKAVCFCDIPIHHLPLHMKKYGVIGLGFNKKKLVSLVQDIQPVRYHYVRDVSQLQEPSAGLFDHSRADNSHEVTLDKYVKIQTTLTDAVDLRSTNSETFNQIYEEREWRSFNPVKLKYEDIAYIILPDRKFLSKNRNKIEDLVNSGIGILYANDLFQKESL